MTIPSMTRSLTKARITFSNERQTRKVSYKVRPFKKLRKVQQMRKKSVEVTSTEQSTEWAVAVLTKILLYRKVEKLVNGTVSV